MKSLGLSNPLQPHGLYSPTGSSVHGIFQARIPQVRTLEYTSGLVCCRSWDDKKSDLTERLNNNQKLEEARKDLLLEIQRGCGPKEKPAQLTPYFRLPASRTGREYISVALSCPVVVLCYAALRSNVDPAV